MHRVTFTTNQPSRPGVPAGADIVDLCGLAPDVRTMLESGSLEKALMKVGDGWRARFQRRR